ncbi:hypothetical protein HEP86_25895 [Streptomyces sp. RPA4-5]|uniref:hypothetical protein n=1 Tax=Streptomyces sp. RPA4-5 TaxID=2721245 RepID=UPI00143E373A|nr:hypothetical protein [Streptomyces sp. RPA4-5]QIY57324.1 hypothetical protein HEP86_25895 [Streptomyces sp. RPA4-5]
MSVERSNVSKRSKLSRIAVALSAMAVFFIVVFVREGGWRNPGLSALTLTFTLSAALSILAWRKERLRLAILAMAMIVAVAVVAKILGP